MIKQTTINILTDDPIDNFIIEDLNGNEKTVKNNSSTSLELSWYLLKLTNNKINDILIDNSEVGSYKHTGYYEDDKFKIWIHPNIGYMISTLMSQINIVDLNENLYKNYMLTVDRPINIGEQFPVHIQGFFGHGSGPKWWNKEKRPFPYIVLEGDIVSQMMNEIGTLEEYLDTQADFSGKKGQTLKYNDQWYADGWKMESYGKATLKDYDAESFSGFGKYFKDIGFKQLYQVYTAYLGPLGYINLHTDGNKARKEQNSGNTRFYCGYHNTDNVYFKMAGVGLLPLDKPMLIDPQSFVHSVVNLSPTNTRKSLVVTGIF